MEPSSETAVSSTDRCAVCSRLRGPAWQFAQNSYGDWVCIGCSEWHFHYTLDPDLGRAADEIRFDISTDWIPIRKLEPWELPDYVPDDAVPL